MYSCVNDKIGGVFIAKNRPLLPGEKPKHPHDTSGMIYEATNQLTESFLEMLASGKQIHVSWKIDGTCCKIENGIFYRRRDIRKGSVAPANAILGDVDETGHANIAWIPVNGSKEGEDKYHLSAFVNGNHTSVYALDKNKKPYIINLADITVSTTFELIGQKVQDNLYELETDTVQVTLKKQKETVPRHYLIPHGAFEAPFPLETFALANPLEIMREFVEVLNQF